MFLFSKADKTVIPMGYFSDISYLSYIIYRYGNISDKILRYYVQWKFLWENKWKCTQKKSFQSDALLIHLIYNASKIGFTSLKLYYAQQGAS